MNFLKVVAYVVVSAATWVFVGIIGGAAAMFGFLFDLGAGFCAVGLAELLERDARDDPVYKNKLQELIERNKRFEEERERRDSAR